MTGGPFDSYLYPFEINDSGQAVGWGHTETGSQAFLWTSETGLQLIPGFEEAYASRAYAINELGQIVGHFKMERRRRRSYNGTQRSRSLTCTPSLLTIYVIAWKSKIT